jgi:phosphatidylinositol alpha-mannosyltransferase
MRVALVSPYSWTYPGGVTRHIESLAGQLIRTGHDVRVLAPFDPDVRRTAILHRGARPQPREIPEWLVPLGGTLGWPSNGAVSNLAGTPSAISTLRRELRAGAFDVVHLHEPVAPVIGWDALTSCDAPLVGTFHCYSESALPHRVAHLLGARRKLNHLAVRIAVSDAAAWTGSRFYGGRYRVVPNGVELPEGEVPPARIRLPGEPLRIVFVGQAVERKGLPVLLRAFEALRSRVPAELVIVGASEAEVAPLLVERSGVTVLGRVSDAERHAVLERADLLCAPSLGGESFGMVLTEAFAAGTGVVASDIAGYRDVVSDGVDGMLVGRGDAKQLAEVLRDLALDPHSTRRLGTAARASAERYAWPHVAEQVVEAYADARAVPTPATSTRRAGVRIGTLPADGGERAPAHRLASLEPSEESAARASRVVPAP